ncbi:DUF4011 domain-containing protein [Brevundimonas diminuta]|uniref:DUF4011 domain-containing protein n=1 Tax=Brevundimonas diminuta TaxID=293 RepID=UPI00069B767C|nr:DUF4011 domain-containing protein [Brevundimonas diminuta]
MAYDDAIEQRLQRLRTKLLDLTTTNRMLSYRHPRASCLRVVDELPGQLFSSLIDGETFVFDPVPEPTLRELEAYHAPDANQVPRAGEGAARAKPDVVAWAKHLGIRVNYDLTIETDEFEREERHRDRKIQALDYPDALDARLRKVRAAGRTAIEESGANMLYLAFGFLEWKDQSASKAHQAPLVLLPVELEREARRGGYRTLIRWTGEELQTNLSLRKKLEEFGIVLPVLKDEQSLEDYLTDVSRAVRSKPDWLIRRYVTLGLFEFGKILLYLDLDPERWPSFAPITEHALVRRVLSSDDDEASESGSAAFEETDSAALLRDLELEVVDRADSSQCEALQVALGGRNLVVQGPPGTGKSQTITNLIAAAMARGKTVLFVAEKLAALEVVRRRLRELGLGEFCLELHSHKTRKTEALEDIGDRILAGSRPRTVKDYDTARERLARRRDQLSAYVTIISSPAGNMIGLTVSGALMRAGQARRKLGAEVASFESVAAKVRSAESTWATLADAKSRLDVLRKAFVELGSSDGAFAHPWAGVAASAAMPNDAERVARLADEWADAGDRLLKLTSEASYRAVPVPAWETAPSILEELRPLRELCSSVEPILGRAEELLNRSIPRSPAGVGEVRALLKLASAAPTEALDLRSPQLVAIDLVDWAEELDLRVNELRRDQARTQSVFRDAAFEADPDDLEEWSAALGQTGLFARFGRRWRAASKAWSARCRPAHLKESASAKSEAFAALRNFLLGKTALLNDASVNIRLGANAEGLNTRTEHLLDLARWAAAAREQLPGGVDQLVSLPMEVLGALTELATDDNLTALASFGAFEPSPQADSLWESVLKVAAPEELQPILHAISTNEEWGKAVMRSHACAEAAMALSSAEDAFAKATMLDHKLWFSGDPPTLEGVVSRARYASQHAEGLPAWLDFDRARAAAVGQLEEPLVDLALRGKVDPQQLLLGLDFVVFDSLARTAFREAPALLSISGKSLDVVRSEYAALDAQVMELRRAKIAAELFKAQPPAGRQSGLKSELSEMALIRNELSKQRRHIPIRQLVLRAGKALQALKPCFMMGPLSVAQYVAPGKLKFDLVIMDEASQMRPEDAIGALARGKQAVIVGDTKQLPPTSFFDRIADARDDDVEDEDLTLAEDSKSILELASSIFDERMLKWHYRSRHEALIAFSNKQFYKNELIVFPSPSGQSDRFGVGWNFVSDGATQKGVNGAEARRVAKAAGSFLVEHPGRSLGVVAMNVKQAQRIADELAALANADARLSDALGKAEADAGEPFFIKNLENVQGDERDVIMISMTYGPADVGGRTPQNFGPINQGTGWRRLNVLFTRAKERMEIFSTMRSTDIVPKEGGDLGPRSLKLFLEYAETGRLGVEPRDVGRPTDSDFEDAVLEGLRELGFECSPQLGVANFFLDIGVRDPNATHEFIAAVECDGAAYHSSKSARDRDRLRQEILEGLGWNVIRVWSTDWFRDPARELDRVVSELKRLIDRREHQRQLLAASAAQKPAEKEVRGSPAVRLEQQPSPKAPAVAAKTARVVKGISVEQARAQLIDLRERTIRSAFPDVDPTRGFLRKSMLDELLRKRPTDNEEFLEAIPQPLREATDRDQVVRYREQVFDILAQIIG